MKMEHVNTLPLTDAVNPLSDEPGELTEVLNCATNLQYMQHGDFRKDLNHMIGHMGTGGASDGSGLSGRDKAKLSSFSPLAVSLKQTYNSISGNEDLTDAEVMHILYTVMKSELWPQSVPSHWQLDTGVEFNGALDTNNAALDSDSDRAFQHRLKALIGQAKEVANVRWQECLSGLPLNCEFVLYIQSKRKGTCGQEFDDALERHVHLKGHIVHPKAKCRLPGCNDLAFDTKMAAADHAWDLHAVPLGTSSNCLMISCRYCELYVWEPIHTSGRCRHFQNYLDKALDMVRTYGYWGVTVANGLGKGQSGSRQYIPGQCIWCLHDESWNAVERIALSTLYSHAWGSMSIHLKTHFDRIADDAAVHCLASQAAGAEPDEQD